MSNHLFQPWEIHLLSLPKTKFNAARWREEVLQNFEKIGFSNPEGILESYRSSLCPDPSFETPNTWDPNSQTKDLIFFSMPMPLSERKEILKRWSLR